jgi:phosphoglycolate phosphatase
MQAMLSALDLMAPGRAILHIAPEKALSRNLQRAHGAGYAACDLRDDALTFVEPGSRLIVSDLVEPNAALLEGRYDVLIHSHVMEHLRGSWQLAFLRLHALLKPGGWHLFAVPLLREWSSEDLGPMSEAERLRRFGQHDHYRWIGRRDFERDMHGIVALTGSEPLRSATEVLGPDVMARIAGDPDVYALRQPEHGRVNRQSA